MAISTLNGADLAGRKLLVREDREDRDVRAARGEGGAEGEGGERPPRRERPPPRPRAPRPPREERPEASSGLQVVVQGLPWSYTWKVREFFFRFLRFLLVWKNQHETLKNAFFFLTSLFPSRALCSPLFPPLLTSIVGASPALRRVRRGRAR